MYLPVRNLRVRPICNEISSRSRVVSNFFTKSAKVQARTRNFVAPRAHATANVPVAEETTQSTGDFMIYNTLSRKKEVFTTREDQGNRVGMYVCGVTVYDFSHIGHARAYVSFDVLYRYLMSKGYDVTYCRNFTDVDDKIIKRSTETGISPEDLTNRFIAEFHKDVESLYCLPPSVEPKVTESIPSIVAMIGTIIDNGHAYAVDGDVYFNVPSLNEYGVLSGRNTEDNRAGERVSVDARKKHPADFALWKAAKEGEISWESPWGPGRPGKKEGRGSSLGVHNMLFSAGVGCLLSMIVRDPL
ncbi:hypothetical protein CYMTET_15276 [Cymbomonas tetramitiformis]|uniref:tRNA synthetases class I catalytic domain-containing protein n=1 Tax=Cymbomonas tetramitiformis TaxID=36881 RepID=A0AAE0GET3_9CHLO|nr:hypothetical protein CYMTET_15276 [Cymbomonas tetramitiformis]